MNEIEKRFEEKFKLTDTICWGEVFQAPLARNLHKSVIKGGSSNAKPAIPKGKIKIESENRKRVQYDAHPNDIYSMKPADSWELYIDESGSFEDAPTSQSSQGNVDNRRLIAGVIFPSNSPLKDIPALHACENNSEEQYAAEDEVISNVLMAGRETR